MNDFFIEYKLNEVLKEIRELKEIMCIVFQCLVPISKYMKEQDCRENKEFNGSNRDNERY